jgi:hypothetical protein
MLYARFDKIEFSTLFALIKTPQMLLTLWAIMGFRD